MNKFIVGNTELTAVNIKKVNTQLSLLFTSCLGFTEIKALFMSNTSPIIYRMEYDSGEMISETNYTGFTTFRNLSVDSDEVYTVKLEMPTTADVIANLLDENKALKTALEDLQKNVDLSFDELMIDVLPSLEAMINVTTESEGGDE